MTIGTIILPCTCKHEFQDERYGKGNRVHNISGTKEHQLAFCTVCAPNYHRNKVTNIISPSPQFGITATVFPRPPRHGKPVPKQ